MPGYPFVVAGDNFYGNTAGGHRLEGGPGTGFGRVQKGSKTGKHQSGFVENSRVGVLRRNVPKGNAQHPKAFFA